MAKVASLIPHIWLNVPEHPTLSTLRTRQNLQVFVNFKYFIFLPGNCLIIWAVVVSGGLQKPVYWLFGGLSSSSIVLVVSQSLVLIPQTLVTVEQTWILGEFSCYLINVLSTISTVSSTMFILLIAFERYDN